jgi:hypothetical protein
MGPIHRSVGPETAERNAPATPRPARPARVTPQETDDGRWPVMAGRSIVPAIDVRTEVQP